MTTTEIEPALQSQSLVDRAYQDIRGMILDLRLPPGQSITIPELAERLGMSRTPVNQAIARLKAEGLVIATPRRGMAVRVLTTEDLREIYQIIAALEGQAASLAAQQCDEETIQRLAESVSAQKAELDSDNLDGWLQADLVFHSLLIEAAGNRRMRDMLQMLNSQLRPVAAAGVYLRPKPYESVQSHRALVEAIGARDPERARQIHLAHRNLNLRQQESSFAAVLALAQHTVWQSSR